MVTDAAGNVVKQLDYDSFGQLIADSAPAFYLPIGFAGGLADVDTGLVRFGFRDYDPAAGRWTAKDPIFFKSGQANLYEYCFSDPVNYVDLDGLNPLAIPMVTLIMLMGLSIGLQHIMNASKKNKKCAPTGSYTNYHESGTGYAGKGDEKRAAQSAKEKSDKHSDPLNYTDWTKANSNDEAFIQEHRRLEKLGGPDSNKNYNKINSPGKNILERFGLK